MVKQFSNAAIDSAFSFVFKIIDFGKILVEVFWGFIDIWAAFFGIFYNFFMYFYYIFLFMIDRGSETSGPVLRSRKRSQNVSKIPSLSIDKTPSVIPSMYRVKTAASDAGKTFTESVGNATAKTADTVQKVLSPIKDPIKSIPKGSKKPFFKSIFEFIIDYFVTVKDILTKPFILIAEFFAGKLTPVKENEPKNQEQGRRISLIDQYMKEYEKQKKR
jgi:hypothetical protein